MPSALKLTRDMVSKFRDFNDDGTLTKGLDYLRRKHAPVIRAGKVEDMMHSGIQFQAYMQALEDVETLLTEFPKTNSEPEDHLAV